MRSHRVGYELTLEGFGAGVNSSEPANGRLSIEGHTDTVGAPAYNKALSERQADAVDRYLNDRRGVRPARLEAPGMGATGPLEPTPLQMPDARNRRDQWVNLGT